MTSAGLPSLRGGTGRSRPSGVTIRTGPWMMRGPFGFGVMVGVSLISEYTHPPGVPTLALRLMGCREYAELHKPHNGGLGRSRSRQSEGPHARTRRRHPQAVVRAGTAPRAAVYLQAAPHANTEGRPPAAARGRVRLGARPAHQPDGAVDDAVPGARGASTRQLAAMG